MRNHWILWKQLDDFAKKHQLNQGIWPKQFGLTFEKAFPDEQVSWLTIGASNNKIKIKLMIVSKQATFYPRIEITWEWAKLH
jgi:hypothetical protein